MEQNKTDLYVFAHWLGMESPQCIGVLSTHQTRSGRKKFSFEYDKDWLGTQEQLVLDPDIQWHEGIQYPDQSIVEKVNFGVFLDSMPDRWGQTLMKRREAQKAKKGKRRPRNLYEIDYLLGVHDFHRMGALRFKLEFDGDFLDNDSEFPTPPITTIRALQHSVELIESDEDSPEINKHLALLIAPGSSLGGARPKANVLDDEGHPWIAKFPSKNDDTNKAAWEMLAYILALDAGICMAESRLEKTPSGYDTFLTKRFDRLNGERIHFASAMTMTGNNEDSVKIEGQEPSYLDLAEFIQYDSNASAASVTEDLHQLWRRIVFHVAISNTDDHLRNHGFIIQNNEWRLSPAYDINPSIEKDGLAITIDGNDNSLDLDLVKSVGEFFQLDNAQMDAIIMEVKASVINWRKVAIELGIPRKEQELMLGAFLWG